MNSEQLATIFLTAGITALAFALVYMIVMGFVFADDTQDPFGYCLHQNEFPWNLLCSQQAIHDVINDVLNTSRSK